MQSGRLDQAVYAYGQGPFIWSALVYGTPSLVDASGVVECCGKTSNSRRAAILRVTQELETA